MTIIQDIAEKNHILHMFNLNETACLSCLSRNYIETGDILMHFIQEHFQKGIYFSTSIFLAERYCKLLILFCSKSSGGGQPFSFSQSN